MARHAVAVAFAVLIHALLGLVSAMPGPRSAGPRLQCPNCFKPFLKHSHFRLHQASMANTACGRDVSQPMASGWSGGARAAGNVEDLSGQRRAGQAGRLPGIDDSDSDSSRLDMEQDRPGSPREEAGPAAPDSPGPEAPDSPDLPAAAPDLPAGHGGAAQVHTS